MSEKNTKRPRRAVRNIENASVSRDGGQPPYSYKRESKQEAAARIERELRRASGMNENDGSGGDTAVFDPQRPPTGDTKVFKSVSGLKGDHARHVVINPDISEVEKAQREINNAIMLRSEKKRRTAKIILIVCAALALLALIIIIAASVR